MADYGMLDPVRGLGKGLAIVAGTFFPDTANPPTVTAGTGSGAGFTVARSGAGTFLVTFARKYPVCVAKFASLQLSATDDKFVEVGDYSASAGTLSIRVRDISGAAATDVAANANNSISFLCIFSTHQFVK
jgi:hypothetical protein